MPKKELTQEKAWRWNDNVRFFSAMILVQKISEWGYHDYLVLWCGLPCAVNDCDEFDAELIWQADLEMEKGVIYWVGCAESWHEPCYYTGECDGQVVVLQARPWWKIPRKKRRQLLGWPKEAA
ncbi:MAG: hypothetical protein AMS21_00995 [Gemmatimonas sp. SG8_38_2]|nr:MAG: hypothetical protein AMS21_00995 [Gemmatimonas sp. SG8_38_2]